MNKYLLAFLVISFVSVFFFGTFVGLYKIFPYEFLDSSKDVLFEQKTIEKNQPVKQSSIDSLIRIYDKSDIEQKRNFLTEFFWDVGSLQRVKDKSQLPEVESGISDFNYKDFQNLKRIDRLTVEMEYGINSVSYLFLPEQPNEKLILYHQGHGGDFLLGKDTIKFFLDRNFTVFAMTMPLLGMNNQPIVEMDVLGKIKLNSHNQLRLLEANDFNPMKLFLDPIQINLNFLDKEYNFKRYSMIGLSGGGWTTVVYSAIDERISDSFSVASSIPFYLRVDDRDMGDYEQRNIELYQNVNYLELYVLSAYGDGRKHIQIFNKNDPCCFSGNGYETYEFVIKDKISQLGKGNFQIFIDDTHTQHKISDHILRLVHENISLDN
jgi:cephalosporin-C deacetylase-like acetyl esterase